MINKLKPHNNIKNINIEATLSLEKHKIKVSFKVKGKLEAYVFAKAKNIQRENELWRISCFELFLANDEDVYYELNFSTSLSWNFYILNSYRVKPKELVFLEEPHLNFEYNNNELYIVFELDSKILDFEKFKHYNLACILLTEEERTFWTINPYKDTPDFHNKKSFVKIL